MTYFNYVTKRKADLLRDNPPAVTPGYRILYGYRSGIGLQIIVGESVLTREIIDNAIRSFLAGDMAMVKDEQEVDQCASVK
jgi:hypothetical protein